MNPNCLSTILSEPGLELVVSPVHHAVFNELSNSNSSLRKCNPALHRLYSSQISPFVQKFSKLFITISVKTVVLQPFSKDKGVVMLKRAKEIVGNVMVGQN